MDKLKGFFSDAWSLVSGMWITGRYMFKKPVTVLYPGSGEVEEQASTVVFTNTFGSAPPNPPAQPASQVVARPAFTG